MIQSGRNFLASSGLISGSGFAIAKITGSLFKDFTISSVKTPAAETPIKTSAPTQISARVVSLVMEAFAIYYLNTFIPSFLPG